MVQAPLRKEEKRGSCLDYTSIATCDVAQTHSGGLLKRQRKEKS